MSALSNHAETLLHQWLLTGNTATRPSARYLALFTSPTTDSGSGTEVGAGGYSRQVVTFNVSGATASNAGQVAFTATGGNFGTVTHIAIYDAASGGNSLWHGALDAARIVNDGDTLSFAAGAIDLTLD